jgi:hypothetical protein
MILSMPGISVSGSHFQSDNNNKIIQEAYAQYGDKRYDDYKKKPHDNYKKDRHADYKYTDYKKKAKKNFAEIERFDDKLFVCDNGIVVDDRTQCPLKCPFGTTLDGAYVMDLEICDIEPGTAAKKCPVGTDLEGVLVMKKSQCDIFAECAANSPLGESLGTLVPVKVADEQLCQLSVPEIEICPTGFFEGFAVNNLAVCNTILEGVEPCGPETDLPGMLTNDPLTCDRFTTCEAATPLGMALGNTPVDVVDGELCNLVIPPEVTLETCPLDTPMGGAMVTDLLLCQAPNDANKCPMGTDLEGVYVMTPESDCNIFEECQAGTPLGMALGDQPVKVADSTLCELNPVIQDSVLVCDENSAMPGVVVQADQQEICGNNEV